MAVLECPEVGLAAHAENRHRRLVGRRRLAEHLHLGGHRVVDHPTPARPIRRRTRIAFEEIPVIRPTKSDRPEHPSPRVLGHSCLPKRFHLLRIPGEGIGQVGRADLLGVGLPAGHRAGEENVQMRAGEIQPPLIKQRKGLGRHRPRVVRLRADIAPQTQDGLKDLRPEFGLNVVVLALP